MSEALIDDGSVSGSWRESTLGEICSWLSGGTPSKAIPHFWSGRIPWVSPKDMKVFRIADAIDHISDEALSAGSRLVENGTVLIVIRGMILAHSFPVAYTVRPVAFNQDIKALNCRDGLESEYLAYWLLAKSHEILSIVSESTHGTKRFDLADLQKLRFDIPPQSQQRKIARILTTLDNVIIQTEALIAKYKAIKQGLMHDLFTQGVDATGKLRPPQSEAPELYKQSELGWIPKEWEVISVGNELLGIDAGKSPDCPDLPASSGEWGVLKVSAVQPDGFRSMENKVVRNPIWVNPSYEVHDGDLLISRCNTYQLVGLVCLVQSPQQRLMICDKTLRLRVDPRRALVPFMFCLLQQPVVRRHIEIHATGTSGSMKNISQPVIRSARAALPPVAEQSRITSRIQAIEHSIRAEQRIQDKLRTQKTGLMQDLLTGKVSVNVEV